MTIHEYLQGKKILVFGIGRQGGGLGDANYLASHGYTVRATDMKTMTELGYTQADFEASLELTLGEHKEADIDWCDILIKNPAVPDDHPLLSRARTRGVEVATAISLFVKYASVKTIGITGTRGKTTTTALIYQILDRNSPGTIILGGNIPGTSGLSLFDQSMGKEYAVLELSSFQLHSFHDLQVSPTYSVVTNLYPDHLNRYPDMQSYAADKTAIVKYQKVPGFNVYNQDNEGSVEIASHSSVTKYPYTSSQARSYQTKLVGDHNQSNIAAAVVLCQKLGVSDDVIRAAVSDFKGVPHRLELVRTLRGINFVNDTTATTPVAALIALRAIKGDVILICGGESKKLPHEDFVKEIISNDRVKKVIFLGSHHIPDFTEAIAKNAAHKIAGQLDSMDKTVKLASELAKPGDSVLLSPGFASFDLFKNEFDRGDQFNTQVLALS